jgi:hypothetical protein
MGRTTKASSLRSPLGLRLAFPLVLAAIVGCSSSTDDGANACATKYKGKCGQTCASDTSCATGTYCGAKGTCTADCATSGASCGSGLVCSGSGRCQPAPMFGGGAGTGGGGSAFQNRLGDAGACLVDQRQGEGLPADIYIMNDQSQSMSCAIPTGGDRWTAMTSALTEFVNSPSAAGLGVGLQYFGLGAANMNMNMGGRRGGGGVGQDSCDPAVYTPADVEIAPLPGNAQAVIASLGRHQPSTYTPTPAAIDGAIAHAKAWQIAHPERIVAVVLATDGQPNLCGNAQDRIGDVANSAAAALSGTPSIRTYVVGIIGGSSANGGQGCSLDPNPPNKADLDRVAQAGGTATSFIVDAAAGDASAQFLDALSKIRGAAVDPCQYIVPATTASGGAVDPSQVNVTYTPSGGAAQALLQSPNAAGCPSTGGWYYDNPTAPTKILLCPATCSAVKADAKATVQILMGCQTNTIPTR